VHERNGAQAVVTIFVDPFLVVQQLWLIRTFSTAFVDGIPQDLMGKTRTIPVSRRNVRGELFSLDGHETNVGRRRTR
jgi:hypothetical protein